MRTFNLRITRPSPSIYQDLEVFQAASYADAVQVAHEAYRRTGRSVSLGSGAFGLDNWHYVDCHGVATDRNTNSGVPARQEVR